MITQVNATFVNGILKPDEALPLAEQSRVRLTLEPIEDWSQERALLLRPERAAMPEPGIDNSRMRHQTDTQTMQPREALFPEDIQTGTHRGPSGQEECWL
jgi:predicted DNA-binding antitoxin AbrB/MazE fold protein